MSIAVQPFVSSSSNILSTSTSTSTSSTSSIDLSSFPSTLPPIQSSSNSSFSNHQNDLISNNTFASNHENQIQSTTIQQQQHDEQMVIKKHRSK